MTPFDFDTLATVLDATPGADMPRDALTATAAALARDLIASTGDARPPFLDTAATTSDLELITETASDLAARHATIIILGTGGSSLGGQSAVALTDRMAAGADTGIGRPRIAFADSPCPDAFDQLLASVAPETTHFIAISKSGGTPETVAQLLAVTGWLEDKGQGTALKDRITLITESGASPLRRFGESHDLTIIEHPLGLGGRYSVLSLVGMLPAALAGLDVAALRRGALNVIDAVAEDPAAAAPVQGAALMHGLTKHCGITQTVIMPYIAALDTFTRWYAQLWAESIGKDGIGTTPVRAVGPTDQHSLMQLFLDGPNDKVFTLIDQKTCGRGAAIPADLAAAIGTGYLGGNTLGDLIGAQGRATGETLRRKGRPLRQLSIGRLTEETLGALFMSFMIETVLTCRLAGVDPFDQPAVEDGKILTRAYLEEDATPGA